MAGPDAKPICVILAGPNGAGKSTAAPFLLSGIPQVRVFVNADTIARGLSAFAPDSVAFKAGRLMLERLDELANNGVSFSFETTLASHSYVRRLRTWKEKHGYRLLMFYLWLPDPETAVHRVRARVAMGGHDVPEETIVRRWHRSRRNFLESYRGIMDEWYVFVASDEKALRCFAYQVDKTHPKVLEPSRWIALTTPR